MTYYVQRNLLSHMAYSQRFRFERNDRTYELMESLGSLRLISNQMISYSVSNYYSAQARFKIQEEVQTTRTNSYFDLISKLFDVAVFQEMLQIFPYKYHEPQGNPA